MKKHEYIRQMLPLAVSGDLSPREMRQVNEHIAKCVSCRQASEDFAALGAALRSLPTPQPPLELVSEVCRQAEVRLAFRRTPANGAAFLAPLVVASWIVTLATWPAVCAMVRWFFSGWHMPSGILGSVFAAYSVVGLILACTSALAVGMGAREFGRTK